jgi:hypothetical protein
MKTPKTIATLNLCACFVSYLLVFLSYQAFDKNLSYVALVVVAITLFQLTMSTTSSILAEHITENTKILIDCLYKLKRDGTDK